MSYIHRNNLKQFPDPYLSPTGYQKVDKERLWRFLKMFGVVIRQHSLQVRIGCCRRSSVCTPDTWAVRWPQ